MIETDPRVKEMLDRVVPPVESDAADWEDVLRRAELGDARDGGRVRGPAGSRRRPALYALAGAALLTALLVNPAFGIGPTLIEWFQGSPAPDRVKANLDYERPSVVAEDARGVIAIETEHGPAYLWVAPTRSGDWCTYVETPSEGERSATSACPISGSPLAVTMSSQEYGGDALLLVAGRAAPRIHSLELRLTDGAREAVRVVEGWFLYEVPDGRWPAALVGRDREGDVVASAELPPPPP